MKNISHWADIVAVPFFLLLTIYFHKKPQKSLLEWILMCFALGGLVADIVFTYGFLYN